MKKERGVPLRRRPIKAICIPGTFAAIAKTDAYRQLWLTLKITRENGMWSTNETRVRSRWHALISHIESILLFSRDSSSPIAAPAEHRNISKNQKIGCLASIFIRNISSNSVVIHCSDFFFTRSRGGCET